MLNRFNRFSMLVLIGLSVSLSGHAWAVALSFNPSTSYVNIGDQVAVDIIVSGLGDDDLSTFDFNVNYDPTILSFGGYSLGDGLGDLVSGDAVDWSLGDLGGGSLNLAELSWLFDLSFQADTFTLATISFTGLAVGNSSLTFSPPIILGDSFGEPIDGVAGVGSIEAGESVPIPEPGTMFLFGIGLVGIAAIRKKLLNKKNQH